MDSHTHFIAGGFELAGVQLRDASTPEEFARRIAEFASAHPAEWTVGGTWDHELWGVAQLPRRDWIDGSRDTPVFVSRLDGHMALANSRALELAGVTAETGDPAGGTIVRDPDGRPTGILRDNAMALVSDVIPLPSEAERDRALARGGGARPGPRRHDDHRHGDVGGSRDLPSRQGAGAPDPRLQRGAAGHLGAADGAGVTGGSRRPSPAVGRPQGVRRRIAGVDDGLVLRALCGSAGHHRPGGDRRRGGVQGAGSWPRMPRVSR